jgi:diguanylate cyclase (GGDEF)-like protein/PAS domain S-box-containing protein
VRTPSEAGVPRPSQRDAGSLLDKVAIGVAWTTLEGRILDVNPKLCQLLGQDADALAGTTLADLTHPEDAAGLRRGLADLARGAAASFAQRQRCLASEGQLMWVDLTLVVVPTDPGTPDQVLAQFVDVTAEVQNLHTLHASALHFQVLSENSTDIVAQTDPQGIITWVSPSVTDVLGWETGLLAGTSITAFVPKPDLGSFSDALATARQGGEAPPQIVRFRSTTGAYRFMSVSVRPMTVDGGLVTGIALGLRDTTEELRAKRELARTEEQFRMAMHGAPEGMAVTDAQDRIVQANPALCELLGTTAEQLIGHRFREFMPFEERTQVEDLREELRVGGVEAMRLEHRLISASGEVWVDHSVGVLRDDGGRPQLFVHQFADRTETRRMQADLRFQATHDVQTGLANRANLLTRLEERLGLTPNEPEHVGVLWCDIDDLKHINDTLGHRVGDAAIAWVAERLKATVRHQDVVGRVGGDEFVIVLDQCPDAATLMTVAESLQRAASGTVPTPWGEVPVTVSVGAVLAAPTTDTDEALSRADHAMYRAKRAGRNRVAGEAPDEPEGGRPRPIRADG